MYFSSSLSLNNQLTIIFQLTIFYDLKWENSNLLARFLFWNQFTQDL